MVTNALQTKGKGPHETGKEYRFAVRVKFQDTTLYLDYIIEVLNIIKFLEAFLEC